MMKHISILVAAVLLATVLPSVSPLSAQQSSTGMITGKVVDQSNGEPVIRATVQLVGTKIGALSNVDGTYTIKNVEPGTYTLKVTYLGYGAKVIEQITIEAGRTIHQDVTLVSEAVQGESITVTGKANKQSENAALVERKRSAQVSDAISSEQISRASASDAGDAMKRVTGVSVVGEKYVVVRGLNERYSSTQLNNINLPSPEPEKKVVPFDIFPSSMVSRLTTIKTFTPDNPGDFAGGLVKIDTKDFPESFLLNVNVGTGLNTETQGANALTYPGGGTDFLGLDDGTRALPSGIAPGRRTTPAEQIALINSFTNNNWLPEETSSLPVNQSYGLSIGNLFDAGVPLGLLVSGSYSNSFSYREGIERYPLLALTDGKHDLRYDYDTRSAEQSTLWGGLLNLSAQLAPEHKVSLKTIYNHSSDDESKLVTGLYNQSTTGDLRYSRLRFVERSLMSAQLSGEHQFETVMNSKLDWRAALSTAGRIEPDNRATTYLKGDDGIYRFANNFGSGNSRFFSDLDDREWNFGADWAIPFELIEDRPSRLKVGGLTRFRERDFTARRFVFGASVDDQTVFAESPEELFTATNIANGLITFDDNTLATDQYSADEQILAGYAMVDMPFTNSIRVIAGARVEQWNLNLLPFNQLLGIEETRLAVDRSELDILPSLNLVLSLTDDMNVRASFSQTLARPEFRELAPFRFDDYRQSTFGNPALERTKILNYDLRWEMFPCGGEVIAASLFFKSFTNPIEQFYLVGSDINTEPVNATDAISYGAEFELRKGLDELSTALEGFSIGTNLTLVTSEVSFEQGEFVQAYDGVSIVNAPAEILTSSTRPLQGQSPYVINAILSYDNQDWGTSLTALYNVFGERLAVIGSNDIPDTYEQPRNSLDFNLKQRLPAGLQLSFSAKNLLDEETIMLQEFTGTAVETIETERRLSGRSFSLSISFNLDQWQLQNLNEVP